MMTFSRKQLSIPYVIFLVGFVVLPLFVVLYYALTNGQGEFTLYNFISFFRNAKTMGTLFYSFVIALVTTAGCLIIAYPTAYILARGPFSRAGVLVVLLVLPMWINFTLRITAVKEILSLVEGNLAMYPFFNTVLCLIYDFLPFMILPLYSVMVKIDKSLIEAASDLGCSSAKVLFKVIVPLSVPGITSGVTMVFVPAISTFIISRMLGGGSNLLIGDLIEMQFLGNSYNPHLGAAISLVLMVIILVIMTVMNQFSPDDQVLM